ncbi:unnamed protein product [Rotaria sordida]|uniref:Ricin B lectin domain-containing protein n=1 Tax=Rotaria sordida TaxID=392033 RepID=A0A815J9G7_9BILA|nr:unnamed protein product [Rotaria sordida]CAF1376357.1 unnamed protein product [Rotaria sordida]
MKFCDVGIDDIISGGRYQLIHEASNKALDIHGEGTHDGTNVEICTNHGGKNQLWVIHENQDGTVKLINPHSGKALDVFGGQTSDGTNVQIWTDNESNAQRWRLKSVGDGIYKLIHAFSGKALDVTGGETSDGTNVQIWTENYSWAQKWRLIQFHGSEKPLFHGMDTVEKKIFMLINSHRQEHGLPLLEPSVNLANVAHTHAVDVVENSPDVNGGNLHSWSNKGKWRPVTYTPDHKYAHLMWSKPSEISNYKGAGYEISMGYGHNVRKIMTMDPNATVDGWKRSSGHNAVMIQQGAFSTMQIKVMGAGVYKGYACVWFGEELDTYPAPA